MTYTQPTSIDSSELFHGSPFQLANQTAYHAWKSHKLERYPRHGEDLYVDIHGLNTVTAEEQQKLLLLCRKANMAVYRSPDVEASKEDLRQFCARFGLQRLDHNLLADEDGISALHVVPKGSRQEYIPYSNHLINWHTDGYYNDMDKKIKAMVLHCVRPALQGGANTLLDHEIVYMLMRDTNADFVFALMQEDAMCIPANVQDGQEIRGAQTGPVFSIDAATGNLHMRYTARTRSIQWKDDTLTQQAVKCLEEVLRTATDYIFQLRLNAGEGVISNNVLHTRSAFTDGDKLPQQRLLYRARYYDRMANTDVSVF